MRGMNKGTAAAAEDTGLILCTQGSTKGTGTLALDSLSLSWAPPESAIS